MFCFDSCFSDDLAAVIGNESGRPTNRFSLRLSSQLMRGLVRLYEKKVNVFLSKLSLSSYCNPLNTVFLVAPYQ